MKNNTGVYRIVSDAYPYTLLGQSGQCTADFEYQIPNTATSPTDTTLFPSFHLIQVSVDNNAVRWVRPDQAGKVYVVLNDPNNSISSLNLSLLLASGEEILLPASSSGRHEYVASIPTYIPAGFIDIVAKAKDTKGNKCELTASPAFYFGSTMDSVRLDARLHMTSYSLNNVETINFHIGDTLNYTLSYTNYGNIAARNVLVTFPTTPYFIPIGTQSWTIDSLGVNDTVHVPIHLVFQGKQQSSDEQIYYSPSITWSSCGTTYLRKHRVLVDFQNTITSVAQTESMIPNKFELYQNYPNPFNPSTMIKYDIAKAGHVSLDMYNILGQQVATLVNEMEPAGKYSVLWDGRTRNGAAATGIYFLRIRAENYVKTIKMLMLK